MSAGKPPGDPFSGSDRTVIRPNPGGRREGIAPPAATPAAEADFWGAGPAMQPVTPAPAVPPVAAPAAAGQPAPPPAMTGTQPMPAGLLLRDGAIGEANPFLNEARQLLILLANLRISSQQTGIAALMDQVAQAIAGIEGRLRALNLPEQQVVTAKYALCATADDIVQNLPAIERNLWTQYSMLSRFFQVRTSGVGFFDELARIKANPALNCDLLELMHACMSLGFEGQYRAAGGDLALQQVRRDVYQTIRHIRSRAATDISPHWKGQQIAAAYIRRTVPVWAVAASAAALLLAVFVGLRLLLGDASDALAEKLAALSPGGKVELARATPVAPLEEITPPKSTQLQRVRAALASDIAGKRVSVTTAGRDIVVRLPNDLLFDRGSATLRDGVDDVLKRVADMLNGEKDEIRVVGYTDNTPIRSTIKFKNNQDLSQKRALAVAAKLKPNLADPARLVTQGRGEKEPAGDNKTEQGRARNRRVDIRIDWID
ncbi:MAG: type IVB secretion system protein IcmH/DotU [Hyphomicrobiales bacterium]